MYAKTVWLDHVTDKPGLYVINDNHDGTWTITPAGKVMQQGTPQDQAHFNNIENGVWDIYAAFGMMFNTVRQQGWQLNETVATIDNSWQIASGSVDQCSYLSLQQLQKERVAGQEHGQHQLSGYDRTGQIRWPCRGY